MRKDELQIRRVAAEDASAIAEIYNYYIEKSVITFEQELVSDQEMAERIKAVTKKFPWFVIERGDGNNKKILGYAYANTWKVRDSYRFAVESSVYISHDEKGQGLGEKIYIILLAELERINIHAIVGGIALPNPGSIRLHEKLGFEKIGQFKEIGYKHNQWVDVGYWQKIFPDSELEK